MMFVTEAKRLFTEDLLQANFMIGEINGLNKLKLPSL